MSSKESKESGSPNDSTDVSDSSFETKDGAPGKLTEVIQEQKTIKVHESDESSPNLSLSISKGNDSSIKLVIDSTPEITKVPDSQYSEGESMGVTSQASTVEIESSDNTADKGTFSPAFGNDGSMHKHSAHHSRGKGTIFIKNEDDHSFQLSQDEIFGSHSGVVSSTPQSVNPRLQPQEEHIDVDMIPSSPEEKKMKSYSLMPALSGGKKYVKKERPALSLTKSPKKGGKHSSIVVEACDPDENLQDKENDGESQETLYKGSEEYPGDECIGDDKGRPKSGLKRKFEEFVTREEGPSTSKCISSDEEVEIVDVKKPRKSVEFIGSKPSGLPLQKCASPFNKSYSSKSSSSSSQSSTSSQKLAFTNKLHLIINSPQKSVDFTPKGASNSEEYSEEDFALRMSPSQGSQLETDKSASSKISVEDKGQECKSTGAMSTILEVDEGSLDELAQPSKEETFPIPEKKDADDNQSLEVITDCEVSGEKSSYEAIRPSSPEYLSDDQANSWRNLASKSVPSRTTDENIKILKGDAVADVKILTEGKGKIPESNGGNGKTDGVPESKAATKEIADCIADPASDLIRSGDPGPPQVHQWLLLHVCSDVDARTGHYSRTALLEMFDYRQEASKEYSKMKYGGRVSDVSKASSMDSKSSACMGDISSPPNAISPQSTSGEGKMFPLPPPRASIMSTYSHSSSSTSGSDLILNTKLLETAKFTKPFLPTNVAEDKIPSLHEVIPDLKMGKRVRLDATPGTSEVTSYLAEQTRLECEHFCYNYVASVHGSQKSVAKNGLEEDSKESVCERRYLTHRPKAKRASLRTKRKLSSSTKTLTPQSSSQSNQQLIEDEIGSSVEKDACTNTNNADSQVPPVGASPTDKVVKGKQTRKKPSRSSQTSSSSQAPSEDCSETKATKSSLLGSPVHSAIEAEFPATPESSFQIGHTEGVILEGALAFARYADNWYYPGKVKKREKDNRWMIHFDDGSTKSVLEDFIVAVEVNVGQSLHADVGEKSFEYEPGIVTKIETKKKEVFYTVELDNGETKILPRSKLCLTEDQVALLREMVVDPVVATPKRKADVSLDNVLEGRTRRKKSSNTLSATTAGTSTPGPSKTSSVKKIETTVYESSSVIGTASDCSEMGYEGISGLDPAASPEPITTPSSKGKGPGRRKGVGKQLNLTETQTSTATSTRNSSNARSQLGPIPTKGSVLFKGKCFILSYGAFIDSSRPSQAFTKSFTDTSTDEYGTDTCEGKVFSTIPFEKKHLRKQLEAGGGRVFDHFKDEFLGNKSCFLISNRPNLTPDFVFALSAGILIVTHEWIINCCAKNEMLPWEDNLLSTGWSIEKKRYIENHERSEKPLKNVEVVLASDSGTRFLEFWRKVLAIAGAHVRKVSSRTMSSQEDISYAAVVVSDHNCPEGIFSRASETGVPIVSTVWVKQTLIHGKMRPFNGHTMYQYDFKDE